MPKNRAINVRKEIINSLKNFEAEDVTSAAIKALTDPDLGVRKAAARTLEGRDNSKVVDALSRAIDDELTVKVTAIRSLGTIKSDDSFKVLIAALENPSSEVKKEAVVALLSFNKDRIMPYLIKMLSDESLEVIKIVIWALGALVSVDAVENLLPFLCDDRPDIRMLTAKSLGLIGDTSAIEALRLALKDADTKTIGIINKAIRAIEAKNRIQANATH